jgi:hypothetical protein
MMTSSLLRKLTVPVLLVVGGVGLAVPACGSNSGTIGTGTGTGPGTGTGGAGGHPTTSSTSGNPASSTTSSSTKSASSSTSGVTTGIGGSGGFGGLGGAPGIGGLPGAGGVPSGCTEIAVGAFAAGTADGTAATYSARTSPNMGDTAENDAALLEFYGPGFSSSNDGDKTGTFDLSMGGDINYATCSRCVSVSVDPSVPGKHFFQRAGTLVLAATSDQLNGKVSGTLTDVTLIEVTIAGGTFVSTPVQGGACLHIASAAVELASVHVPAEWTCDPTFYADGNCDCGCGAADVDCADATAASCTFCDDTGSCNTGTCPGTIDPTDNSTCTGGGAADAGADSGDGG